MAGLRCTNFGNYFSVIDPDQTREFGACARIFINLAQFDSSFEEAR